MNNDSIEERFEYVTLLLASVSLAVAAVVAMILYLFALNALTGLLWEQLPANLPAGPVTVVIATLGGLLVGLTLRYLGGPPGKSL